MRSMTRPAAVGATAAGRRRNETHHAMTLPRLTTDETSPGRPAPALVAHPRSEPLPLSFAQQRLWFIEQLEPGSAAYHVSFLFQLHGPLDVEALRRALQHIVRRHEVLRTSFPELLGRSQQLIAAPAELALPIDSLEHLAGDEQRAALEAGARDEARRPFALASGPMLRARLVRLADDTHALVVVIHHIVCDHWSIGILIRELSAAYPAMLDGTPPPLPALAVQYADFAIWQRRRLAGPELERLLGYWQRQLAGAPAVLELPTDRPRPAQRSGRGGRLYPQLPRELVSALAALARREGVTLFMTLLAAFDTLLWRYSGQQDVVVGTPIAGRNHRELEGLIGLFASTLVLRVGVTGELSFPALLARVRAVCLAAYAHQDLPFEQLVDAIKPERDLSRTPLFQVMFGLQSAPFPEARLGASTLEPRVLDAGTASFDLTLSLQVRDGAITGWVEYSADLFDPATIERMMQHYRVLLEAIVAAPDTRLAALPLLTGPERRSLVEDWNRTAVAPPPQPSVVSVFEDQARRTPDAIAVTWGEVRLSYRELDVRAEAWATALRARGCGRGARVALAVARGPAFPVAVLAVMKAGAAYVPLDPAYPAERLAFMLRDCEARVVLTEAAIAGRLPATAAEVIAMDAPPAGPGDAAASAATPDDLAYVIYTSGSTGRPKGVAMPHRAVLNLVTWQAARSPLPARTLQFASPSFDVSFQELFATWATGGCLVLASDDERRDPAALLRICRDQRIERLFLPFVALHQLAEAAHGAELAGLALREVITAGEQLRITPAIAALFTQLPGCRLYNQYGPTETHLATELALTGPPATWDALPSIGRPIANVRVHVLDGERQPQPIGVPGELYIAGAGVACGYVGRDELTAERFVPDPFGAAGGRMYRTGDRAKVLPSGELVFLGRSDDQVKVRGYRIEPGEIEAALGGHPVVRGAAVVAQTERGATRLCAYVACADPGASVAELTAHLRARLPEYMVPAVIAVVRELPLSPNGKLDRKALPAPELVRAAYVAPRTAMEQRVAAVWEAVLGVERPGATESFFAIGGHSLLATQVVSRLRAALGVELAVRTLFEAPTIAELAGRLDAAIAAIAALPATAGSAAALPALAIDGAGDAGPAPLSFAQQRLWFLEQLEPGGFTYHVPVFLRLRGALDVAALAAGLAHVIGRHAILRTRFVEIDGEPRQLAAGGAAALDVEPAPVAERDLAERARQEARRPFDLGTGSLIRARLLRIGDDDHALLLVLHHLVCDGWSMAILVRELGAAYRSIAAGEPPDAAQPGVQYAEFARWQRAWLTGARLDDQLAYWTRQLAGAPPVLELPADRPRPAVRSVRGAQVARTLGGAVMSAVRAVSQRAGATEFMTLLAAFDVLLARSTGQRDIVVGSPIAGRNRPELEPLIGLFVNTLVLRVQVDDAISFRELIGRVREVCLDAYAHQDLPFEQLVDALKPDRELGRTPVFQVMFALHHAPAVELDAGLVASPIDVDPGMAKFDLTLFVTPGPAGLATLWEYNTDLFDRDTVERMAARYAALVEALVANPDQRPSAVPLVSGAERDQLLAHGAVHAAYPEHASLHAQFDAQVARAPDAPAVVFGDARLSYAELDARASRLAHLLAARGVGREDRVGVCLGRSIDFVVSVVAVIKAGACYVPLDPSYPAERLAYMAADAGVRVVIARRAAGSRGSDPIEPVVAQITAAAVDPAVWLDAVEPELSRLPGTSPPVIATSRDLAYVMYTSGSTGQPKGTCIEQRSIARLVLGTDYLPLDRDDAVAHISNTSFDAATFEIWGALLNGAALHGIAPDVVVSPEAFARELADRGITAMFITTALFLQLAQVAPRAFHAIEHVLVGGEPLDAAAVRRVLAAGPPRRLANIYGPTETTTFATWQLIGEVDDHASTIPIGRPIANTTVRILDPHGDLVPIGVRGEIYIGGPGVARGYWNRPALTAERFVADPFEPGGRLYRTGDLGAWRSDGAIAFHGRADHQVKLRGFRIELGEIEAQLVRCAGVAAACAVVRDDTGEPRLIAYVVPSAAGALDGDALDAVRSRLAGVLPRYMLPGAIVALDRLPVTPNGKLDHRALPAPSGRRDELGGGYLAPEGELEQAISQIWAEILGVDRVGAHDNFFDLGGSSLRLVAVRSRIEALIGRPLPMVALFQHAQVRSLSAHLAGPAAQPTPEAPRAARTAGARRLADQRRGRAVKP
jgi:amino acid adenylation domain-containing protein